ncbi:MAG TPA: hypothetical protein EYH29_03080 [Caldilineales bacterium]|nr:hypothetical protein [Caldilineales bacterium]
MTGDCSPNLMPQLEIQTIPLTPPATVAKARLAVLRAEPGARLLFLLPDDADNFAHLPRLKALRQAADNASVQIGLATRDKDIHDFAQKARIPTYKSEEAARRRWRWPRPEPPLPPPHKMRPAYIPAPPGGTAVQRAPAIVTQPEGTVLWGEPRAKKDRSWLRGLVYVAFIGLVALMLLGVTWYLLPQATVTLIPARTTVISSVELAARTGIEEPDYLNMLAPARVVQARVEGYGTTPTTGLDDAPVGKATGIATFINKTSREIIVPEGAIVRTTFGENVRFRTLDEVTVPAGVGRQVQVQIEAVEPGLIGNVPALTINEIEGPLNISLRVSNPFNTEGGTVERVATVTQEDKDRLKNELLAQLQQQAYIKLGENLRPGEYIPPETVQTFVLAETYDRFSGEHADELGLQLQLLARGLAIDLDGARQLAERSLRESVPEDVHLLEETIQTGDPQFTLFGDEFVNFTMTARGEAIKPIEPGDVRAVLAGAPVDTAEQLLMDTFDLARPPNIILAPSWIKTLPHLPSRIIVRVYKE